MKVLFILLIVLNFAFPLYAEESNVYTDEDLKQYGGGSKSSSTPDIHEPCSIEQSVLDSCSEKDYECKMEWESKVLQCLSDETYYMSTGRRPVRVKIVP